MGDGPVKQYRDAHATRRTTLATDPISMNALRTHMDRFFLRWPFADAVLKGLGQIMLQGDRLTGLFFLVGLFVGGLHFGAAALMATVAGTLTARLLRFSPADVQAGLYGFSAALVGVALVLVFQGTTLIWAMVVAGGVLAAMLQHIFIRRQLPGYTFPFVLITWVFIFVLHQFPGAAEAAPAAMDTAGPSSMLLWGAKSYGQVIFQGNTWSGILFFLGVLVASPRAALLGLAAAYAGSAVALALGEPDAAVQSGLFGFNALLTAIAFSGEEGQGKRWLFIAVLITLALHFGLLASGWLAPFGGVFTFPFVAGCWLTLVLGRMTAAR